MDNHYYRFLYITVLINLPVPNDWERLRRQEP